MNVDRIFEIQQAVFRVVIEQMQLWMNALLQDALDPNRVAAFLNAMGFDLSKLPGIITEQAAFDPYEVLCLDRSASDEDVKRRYNELIHKLHPDKSGTPATSFLFRMVLAAYETIKRERHWQSPYSRK